MPAPEMFPPLHPVATMRTSSVRAVFGQVMFLVAATMGFTAAGAWIGRDLGGAGAIISWIGALALVIVLGRLQDPARRPLAMTVLFGVGLLLGLAVGPTLAAYAGMPDGPQLITQAAALTGLVVAGLGALGWVTQRDLSWVYRIGLVALLALIAFGLVSLFVAIPAGQLVYCIGILIVFAGFTAADFQRLRRAGEDQAVLLACSIYLDVFNIFLVILRLLGGSR